MIIFVQSLILVITFRLIYLNTVWSVRLHFEANYSV